jgi:hypothetical protein
MLDRTHRQRATIDRATPFTQRLKRDRQRSLSIRRTRGA